MMEKIFLDEATRGFLSTIHPEQILFAEKINELIDAVKILQTDKGQNE